MASPGRFEAFGDGEFLLVAIEREEGCCFQAQGSGYVDDVKTSVAFA